MDRVNTTDLMSRLWSRRDVVAGLGAASIMPLTVRESCAAERPYRRVPLYEGGFRSVAVADPAHPATPSDPLPVKSLIRPPAMVRWPPHAPTLQYRSKDSLSEYYGRSEAILLRGIIENLRDVGGYPRCYCFGLQDGGSALATPFERFNRDGGPARQDRFNLGPSRKSNPLGNKPVPLHLRVIVYFLTPHEIPEGLPPKSFVKHRAALELGIGQLSDSLQFLAITPEHRLTAYIYEYGAEAHEEPTFKKDSRLGPLDHLRKSKIIP
jgi:hypothetical protein